MKLQLFPVDAVIPVHIKDLYESAFPLYERRPWQQQQDLVNQDKLQLLQLTQEDIFTGFVFFWHLNKFVFIEHFAIAGADRGKGSGSTVMQLLAIAFPHIVLETEPEEKNNLAARRVVFYEKQGYRKFPYAYQQPSYAPGYPAQAMLLMHNGTQNDYPVFEKIKTEIHRMVYNTVG